MTEYARRIVIKQIRDHFFHLAISGTQTGALCAAYLLISDICFLTFDEAALSVHLPPTSGHITQTRNGTRCTETGPFQTSSLFSRHMAPAFQIDESSSTERCLPGDISYVKTKTEITR